MQTQTHLNDDMHVKFFCVKSNAFIESCALAIIEIHCDINLQHKFDNYVISLAGIICFMTISNAKVNEIFASWIYLSSMCIIS